jgi:hypothetical protein
VEIHLHSLTSTQRSAQPLYPGTRSPSAHYLPRWSGQTFCTIWKSDKPMLDFRLSPRCRWDLHSSGILRGVEWWDRRVGPKRRYGITTQCCVISYKSTDLCVQSFYPAGNNTSQQHHVYQRSTSLTAWKRLIKPLRCFRYLRHQLNKCETLVNLNITSAASTTQGTYCGGGNQWSKARRDMSTHDPQLLVPTRKHSIFLSPGSSVRTVTGWG